MAAFVHAKFRAEGLSLRLGCAVTGFEDQDGQAVTNVDVGPSIAAEMVILAIGVSPDSGLAKAAGLEVGARGSILVDRHMRTSDADIYAVGDAVQVRHSVTGQDALISLAAPPTSRAASPPTTSAV